MLHKLERFVIEVSHYPCPLVSYTFKLHSREPAWQILYCALLVHITLESHYNEAQHTKWKYVDNPHARSHRG